MQECEAGARELWLQPEPGEAAAEALQDQHCGGSKGTRPIGLMCATDEGRAGTLATHGCKGHKASGDGFIQVTRRKRAARGRVVR